MILLFLNKKKSSLCIAKCYLVFEDNEMAQSNQISLCFYWVIKANMIRDNFEWNNGKFYLSQNFNMQLSKKKKKVCIVLPKHKSRYCREMLNLVFNFSFIVAKKCNKQLLILSHQTIQQFNPKMQVNLFLDTDYNFVRRSFCR